MRGDQAVDAARVMELDSANVDQDHVATVNGSKQGRRQLIACRKVAFTGQLHYDPARVDCHLGREVRHRSGRSFWLSASPLATLCHRDLKWMAVDPPSRNLSRF